MPRSLYPFLCRRGAPEVVLNTLAASNGFAAAAINQSAWGATPDEHIASTSEAYILAGLTRSGRVVVTRTTTGSTLVRLRDWIEVMTGAAASEVGVARVMQGVGALCTYGGTDGAATAGSQTPMMYGQAFDPVFVPASTRLSLRSWQEGVASDAAIRAYLLGYKPAELDAALLYPDYESMRRWALGADKHHSYNIAEGNPAEVTLTSGGSSWGLASSFTEIDAALDADYLITGIGGTWELSLDFQVEIGIGAASSEQVHGRMGFPGAVGVNLPYSAHPPFPFPIPFIAYKGERISARSACGTASQDIAIRLYGTRLWKDY